MPSAATPARTPRLLCRPPRHVAAGRPPRGGSPWRHRRLFQPEPGGGPAAPHRSNGGPRILLVDDEPAIRMICRVNLEVTGMTVLEAGDGGQALELVRAERPSLLLLDVMMPGVDGWTVAERLASEPETRELPVVFLSARAGLEDRRRAQELGAVGYIVKPFDPLELSTTVETVLARLHRGERELLLAEIVPGP